MNKFDIKANHIEKTFFRKLKSGTYFFTGRNKKNFIVDFNSKTIFLKTKKSRKAISISRKKLKMAIAYILYRRTATRLNLEKYSNFNSALMGLLRLILIDIAVQE